MAVRTGMQSIIDAVQTLVQEIDEPVLTDQEVQDIADLAGNHLFLPQVVLYPASVNKEGKHNWYRAPYGYLESDTHAPTIKLAEDDSTLTPSTSDYQRGFFKFNTARDSTDTLYLSEGYAYDLYRIASECCSVLIAKIRSGYNVSTPEGNFQRQQRIEALEGMREQYLNASLAMTIRNEAL